MPPLLGLDSDKLVDYTDKINAGFDRIYERLDKHAEKIEKRFDEIRAWQNQIEISQTKFLQREELDKIRTELVRLSAIVEKLNEKEPDKLKFSEMSMGVMKEAGRIILTVLTTYLLIKFGLK